MKKAALTVAMVMSMLSSTAWAANQRPTYMAFKAPTAAAPAAVPVAAAPAVAKSDEGFGTIPFYIPLVGIIAVVGIIAAVSGGGNDNNGSPG